MRLSSILQALAVRLPLENDLEITQLNALKEATTTQMTYVTTPKYLEALQTTNAAAVLVTKDLAGSVGPRSLPIIVDDPELSMAKISRLFRKEFEIPKPGTGNIDPSAVIFPNTSMGTNVSIGKQSRILPGVYLGDNVVIGDDTILHPNCVIYHDCRIGSRCIIHANTVIGSDGFGYAHTAAGEHVKIEQMGKVIIEDDVEIGSNTSIDRATFNATVIGKGSKIDNLVQISHNVVIGEHCIIVGQTGIAGSTTLGRNVVMAAQSGATGHIKIADFSTIAARGGVTKNTDHGKAYAGFPLMEHRVWLKLQGRIARLLS